MRWPLVAGHPYVLGRQGYGADIQFSDASLSKKHCSIKLQPSFNGTMTGILEDLGSTNGTNLNGQPLGQGADKTSGRPMVFRPGDDHDISLGNKGKVRLQVVPYKLESG